MHPMKPNSVIDWTVYNSNSCYAISVSYVSCKPLKRDFHKHPSEAALHCWTSGLLVLLTVWIARASLWKAMGSDYVYSQTRKLFNAHWTSIDYFLWKYKDGRGCHKCVTDNSGKVCSCGLRGIVRELLQELLWEFLFLSVRFPVSWFCPMCKNEL
jgi:hypothetical protein